MNEFEFISTLLRPLAASHDISFSLKDDCCLLPLNQYVVTSDTIVSGTHFFPNDPPESVAYKLLHSNISDLVGKASYPKFYLLNLSLVKEKTDRVWLTKFCEEIKKIQDAYNFSLIGGDTTTGPNIVASASFFGSKERVNLPTTDKAEENKAIFVSGKIGNSYAGLLSRSGKIAKNSNFEKKYLFKEARIDLIEVIKKYALSATDISDGLVIDLLKILKSSNIGAEIFIDDFLFEEEILKIIPKDKLITAGDDYEIIMISDYKNKEEIEKNSDFKFIGKTTKNPDIIIRDSSGKEIKLENLGYSHLF